MKIKDNQNISSRTNNFFKNSIVGIITQFLSLILSFVGRTVFIKLLTNDYLSINGLFSNILSTLSAVELGFGTALIYMMYKPVANDDKEKIKTIVKYYKKVYFIIGTVILVVGISLIPFLKFIIKDPPNIKDNLILIYLLFLIGTCIGYFNSHKVAIINANQKNYIISIYNQVFKWLQLIFQIIFLVITKNYIIYLFIQIICTLFNNIAISYKANKMFPYIKDKNVKDIDVKDKKEINNKVKSLIFYRLNPSILNGSDNLIISAFVGVSAVGLYSNYYLIINYLVMFLNQITASLEPSIGNLNVSADKEKKEEIFYKVMFLCFFIYGITCVLFMALINNLILIWIGKDYIFNNFIVFTIVLYTYVNGMSFVCYSFRTTTGLFEKMKYVPLVEVILNIVISIVLAKYIGISGVFLGTSIARFLTFFWTDPKLLYENLFNKKNKIKYFIKYLKYTVITFVVGLFILYLSNLYITINFLLFILKSCVLGLITLLLFILFTFKSMEFKTMKEIIINKIFKKNN